jgi:8-oxo-dGTP pyrophosphatase MutT (NUDIX family)
MALISAGSQLLDMPLPETHLPSEARAVAARLQSRALRRLDVEHTGRAAVLIPILRYRSENAFLLTQRTQKVETHKGQISFPGGVRDATDDSLLDTALRETQEEIGLAPRSISVLGEFDEYLSITGLIVTPFAAWVAGPLKLKPNPDEVEEVLTVPFQIFRDSRLLRIENRIRSGVKRKVYFYRYGAKEVWGLTAQIIRDFLKVIDDKTTPTDGLDVT